MEKLQKILGNKDIIKLTDNDINYEKSQIPNIINDDNILSLVESLKEELKDLIIKKQDVIYEYKTQNRKTNKNKYNLIKKQELIYFGNTDMFENLNNPNINQYFLDFTYKIIPNKFKPYRLMTLKGFDLTSNVTKLCCISNKI